ncbi:MAG: Ketopantoate reductase ApbA/PanE domain protein [Moraxellaceae bacterium]|jgi:nucleoside-diphosphate-sugar epimerase|nr:Ketopantoate reductase ApbA/PanE domain protein [Moraxellaceae bacterium]
MAKILIIGCGDVGGRLAVQLAAAGHEVHGLRRSAVALPGVLPLQGDVTVPASLQFPHGLDYVFVLLAPGASGVDAYRRVYYEGTRNVLAALQGQGLRRVFWISSSSVYAQDDGSWVDETSPVTGAGDTAKVLLESEALARDSGWPATVVRFAGIYGPGRLRLLRWVESGRAVQAAPPAWSNRIHSEDGAGLLAYLMAQDLAGTALDTLYLGTDCEPSPQHEVLDWIAAQRGLPPVAHETKPGAGSNKRLSNRRLLTLGYRFRFPDYRAGYADVLAAAT